MLAVNVDAANLVSYIMNACKHIPDNVGVAFRLAQRHSLPGADDLFSARFDSLFGSGDYKGAAMIARDAPGTSLRNMDTINKFKTVQGPPGTPSPILVYFSTLLETTKLNEIESVELVKPVLSQGKKNLVEDWIRNDKLTPSQLLGDTIKMFDPQLALSIYVRSGNSESVIQGFVESGQFDKIIPYVQSGKQVDFVRVLQNVVLTNPEAALGLAKLICCGPSKYATTESVAQIFVQANRIQETTAFLLEALKGNRPEEGHL